MTQHKNKICPICNIALSLLATRGKGGESTKGLGKIYVCLNCGKIYKVTIKIIKETKIEYEEKGNFNLEEFKLK